MASMATSKKSSTRPKMSRSSISAVTVRNPSSSRGPRGPSDASSHAAMTMPGLQSSLEMERSNGVKEQSSSSASSSSPPSSDARQDLSWRWMQHGRSTSMPNIFAAQDDYFPVPSAVQIHNNGGIAQAIAPEAFIEMLLTRFYDSQTGFANLIAPSRWEMLQRFRVSHTDPFPTYLVQVIVACSAATRYQPEPEIRAWAPSAWRDAITAVQQRLEAPCAPDLDLVRALLLLTITSAGCPASEERFTSFQTALALAQNLQLTSRPAVDEQSPHERAQRLQLFWILFVVDKLLAVARGSAPLLPSQDITFLTCGDLVDLGLPGHEAHILQGLALASISLMQILESVQSILYASSTQVFETVETAQVILQPLERKLEDWCKSNRAILSQGQDSLTRNVASSVISLLHLVQLQLYSYSLRLETAASKPSMPVVFGSSNIKALVGCIESSLHLIRRGHFPADGKAALKEAIHRGNPTTTPMTFDLFLVDRGSDFLKWLSSVWAGWSGGDGVFNFVPLAQAPSQSPSPQTHSQDLSIHGSTSGLPKPASAFPSTDSFTGRRNSTANIGGAHRVKKAAPAPLALDSNVHKGSSLSLVPHIDTATLKALCIPTTPAHQLFDSLVSSQPVAEQHTNVACVPAVGEVDAALSKWPLLNDLKLENNVAAQPSIEVTAAPEDVNAGPSSTQGSSIEELSALLGFDLQVPLVSPSVPPYMTSSYDCLAPPPQHQEQNDSSLLMPADSQNMNWSPTTISWDRLSLPRQDLQSNQTIDGFADSGDFLSNLASLPL